MIRIVHLMFKRMATCLAVVAALSFVLDGALGVHHHLPAATANAVPCQTGGDGPAAASDQQHAVGDVAGNADVAADEQGSTSHPDLAALGCCCACCGHAAIVLADLNTRPASFTLLRSLTVAHRGHGDGIVPDGLRRPPRPLAIA